MGAKEKILMLDRDEDWIFMIDPSSPEAARKSLEDYFSTWSQGDSRITDATCCLYGKCSMIPNRATTWIGSKFPLKTDHGVSVDYSKLFGRLSLEGLYKCYEEFRIDPVKIILDTLRKTGIRPWITLRMNDAHYLYDDDITYGKEELFYEAVETGHVIGDQYGYFGRCYDFSWPRVRQMLLDLIGEILDRYDMYGLSLDFLREPFCFDYRNNPGCHEIMTEMIRQIRRLLDKAGEKRGSRIKLLVRVPHNPKESLAYGFDVRIWCQENLIDVIEPCARWECVNSGIPVRQWRETVGKDVLLIPGVETLSLKGPAKKAGEAEWGEKMFSIMSAEQVRAYAASFDAQGADGLFLANMCSSSSERNRRIWTIDPAHADEGFRRYIVTFQDIPSGMTDHVYRPLPLKVCGETALDLPIGRVRKTDRISVFVDTEGESAPALTVGGKTYAAEKCGPLTACGDESGATVLLSPHGSFRYDLSGFETDCDIRLSFLGNCVIHHAEVRIGEA